MKKIYKYATKILLLIIFIIILFNNTDLTVIENTLSEVNFWLLSVPIILKILGILASSIVLLFSLSLVEVKLNSKKIIKTYFLSYFFNNFGVGSLGGDTYKFLKLNKGINSRLKTGWGLLNEKIIGLSVLFSFVLISIFLIYLNLPVSFIYILSIPVALIIIILVGFFGDKTLRIKYLRKYKFIKKINHFSKFTTKDNRKKLFYATTFSTLFYLFTIIAFHFIVQMINKDIPLIISFYIIPIVILINTIPISFQGLGLREISISYLFVFLGYSFEEGFSAGILLLCVNLMISILSGLYYAKEQFLSKT